MRELILKRLEELRTYHQNFSKSLMRWQYFHRENIPIWNEDYFSSLDDEKLVGMFEIILRFHYKPL